MTTPLTKEQAVVVSAYTGYPCCSFSLLQEYAERKLGRSIWTHQFGDKDLWKELREATEEDFLSICYNGE